MQFACDSAHTSCRPALVCLDPRGSPVHTPFAAPRSLALEIALFAKILIANRGEIACRIIKTARRLGIATVAVYSDADGGARHVDMADEAVHLGAPAATASYLAIEKIVDACRQTGAEAVHPGYGFLSEREAFATALADAGLVFIGPNPGAIATMGDKITSKKMAAQAGVSTVPGFLGEIDTPGDAVAIADDIGYPVIIKASAGGGGKGMRIAHNSADVAEGFALARSEARSSFGDDRVFIEKFIVNPRHIEIQVLGDKYGNVIHLGERECSLQRRNQKVIEEAPSPLLDADTRQRMGAEAIALARAVNYDSAGTVEFVASQDRDYFFLEMNTRLQVEHPVTEMVTGIDLVEQMIRVAAGEELTFCQSDIKFSGWAVESRIYAEDPYRNFLPSIGRLVRYCPPAEHMADGIAVRNDTGVFEGSEISMYYDPMIAKLVTHGPTREAAIDAQADALDTFYIDGIGHNIPFVSAIMQHSRWRSGQLSTNFIAQEYPDGFTRQAPQGEIAAILIAVAAAIDHLANARRGAIANGAEQEQARGSSERVIFIDGLSQGVITENADIEGDMARTVNVAFIDTAGQFFATYAVASDWWPGQPVWSGTVNDTAVNVQVRPVLNGYDLATRGVAGEARIYSKREAELLARMPPKPARDLSRFLICPMPGLVKDIKVDAGQKVQAGDTLAIVEAMKMENVLRAERDATVAAVKVAPGDSLAVDTVIIEFA